MALPTRDIPDVELALVGRWKGTGCPEGGCELTTELFDRMVEAFQATEAAQPVPVKLGHDDDQKLVQEDGYPAAGWVTNLRRSGKRLLADFAKVPATLADLIDAGGYRGRSIEINHDFEIAGKTYPDLLTGCAILGADMAAVQGLSDMASLYAAAKLSAPSEGARVFAFVFDGAESYETRRKRLDEALQEKFPRTDDMAAGCWVRDFTDAEIIYERDGKTFSAPYTMDTASVTIGEPAEVVIEYRPVTMSGSTEEETMTIEAIRAELGLAEDADEAAIMEAVKLLKAAKPAGDGDGDGGGSDEQIAKLRQDLSAAEKRVVTLEQDHEKAEAADLVDGYIRLGRLLPAQRDRMIKMALNDFEDAKQFLESQPKVVQLGERGTADETVLADLEPTAAELALAKQTGASRISLIRAKAREKGVELPADFGKEEKKD